MKGFPATGEVSRPPNRTSSTSKNEISQLFLSVEDPDPEPDPQDPHVFQPPRSGSISQRCGSGSGSGSFPFLINVLSRLK
jgi:hypothetical protein